MPRRGRKECSLKSYSREIKAPRKKISAAAQRNYRSLPQDRNDDRRRGAPPQRDVQRIYSPEASVVAKARAKQGLAHLIRRLLPDSLIGFFPPSYRYLVQACRAENWNIACHIARFLQHRSKKGNTPAHILVIYGCPLERLRPFLKRAAVYSALNNCGESLLHYAAVAGDIEVVTQLLRMTDVNLQNQFGLTPLHCALIYRNTKAAAVLLDHGADPNLPTKLGNTAVHFNAVLDRPLPERYPLFLQDLSGYSTPVHRYYLSQRFRQHFGAGEYSWLRWDDTAIQTPVGKLQSRTQHLSVAMDGNETVTNNNGNTPLHLAIWKGAHQTIKALANSINCNIRNHDQQLPIDMMLMAPRTPRDAFTAVLSNTDIFNRAVALHEDAHGRPLLHRLVADSHSASHLPDHVVDVIIENWALTDVSGMTLFATALTAGSCLVVEKVLSAHPSVILDVPKVGSAPILIALTRASKGLAERAYDLALHFGLLQDQGSSRDSMAAAAAQGYDDLVLRLLDAGCPKQGVVRGVALHCLPATLCAVLASLPPEAIPRQELDQAFAALCRSTVGHAYVSHLILGQPKPYLPRMLTLAELGSNMDHLAELHGLDSARRDIRAVIEVAMKTLMMFAPTVILNNIQSNMRWLKGHSWSTHDVPCHEHLTWRRQNLGVLAEDRQVSAFMQAIVMDTIFQEPHFSEQALLGLLKWTYVDERVNFCANLAS
eukprot:TRINITY_DN12327_c1_g1_i5.p1 TRINITY_DN12327_c1_g1~~TRINITY_DN12327_c1_g1_i5.p1  ORF type:complete len:712 (+),score=59.93 TRINITY_DN12327_c1_g1_i5:316-2451(+)